MVKKEKTTGITIQGKKVISVRRAKKEAALWKSRTKKAGGYQRPVARALKKSAEALAAATEVQSIVESMNDKGRKLFSSLTMGMSEAEAVFNAGLEDFYLWPHMRRAVTKNGEVIPIQSVTWTMVKTGELHPESLKKMNDVASKAMGNAARNHDYSGYIRDINEAFKIIAPDAFRVVNEVMMDPREQGRVRSDIAFKILDRAGYAVKDVSQSTEMPAQVNILITDNPKGTVEVIGGTRGTNAHQE